MANLATPADVRDFWIGSLAPKQWYVSNEQLDADIAERFLTTWQSAHDGGLQHWLGTAEDILAYVILTDQFSRNMFRGDGRSFETDGKALAASRLAIDNRWDMHIAEPARQFIYMPFMHAEDLAAQDSGIEMFANRMPQTGSQNIDHAYAHRWVIAAFGRFPYRNDAMGRTTAAAEQDFLDAGGYGFALQKVRSAPPFSQT